MFVDLKGILVLLISLAISGHSLADEDFYMWSENANHKYFNIPAKLAWKNTGGDWLDGQLNPQGEEPVATRRIMDKDQVQSVELEVTDAVSNWMSGKTPNRGFLLKTDKGIFNISSRERSEVKERPFLELVFENGESEKVTASADSMLHSSTLTSLAKKSSLQASTDHTILMHFPLENKKPVKKATLHLTTTHQYGTGNILVYYASPMHAAAKSNDGGADNGSEGLLSRYGWEELDESAQVFYVQRFSEGTWPDDRWILKGNGSFRTVGSVPGTLGEPSPDEGDQLIELTIKQGKNTGFNYEVPFREITGKEPEEAYFQYKLRLPADFVSNSGGGKLPGFAGTYGRGGWGGRTSDGENGWSMRGYFGNSVRSGQPMEGRLTLGTYAYYADMQGKYGDIWPWNQAETASIKPDRWVRIEQYVKLNDPAKSNGEFRVWVDDRLVLSKTGLRIRTTENLKIEAVWLNFYHGGVDPAPHDMTFYIDDLIVAREYIGAPPVIQ